MNKKDREVLALVANHAIADSRYASSFPRLTKSSSRTTVLEWLQNNDSNGVYTDEAIKSEGEELEPLTTDEAWESLENALSDDWDAYVTEIQEKNRSK